MDENVDDTEGKTAEEVEEMLKEKEAKANAQILELVRNHSCYFTCSIHGSCPNDHFIQRI